MFKLLVIAALCSIQMTFCSDVCRLQVPFKIDCGYPGIGRETCESKGCCFNDKVPGINWCYFPGTCRMRDSSSRLECGYPGISKSTCESRGCCFDNTIQGVKWCFRPVTCKVSPSSRKECGWTGISKETCEGRGCCFDSSIPNTKWCFHPGQ